MRNNETGEFEVVVGNRQLISAFFIVVLLFAVAFAMGYVVGQNSPRSAKLGAEAASTAPAPAAATDAQAQPSPAGAPVSPPQPAPPQGTDSAAQAPAAAAPVTTPAPPAAESTAPPAEAPASPASGAAPAAAPPGSYWQVMAVNPADAEVVVRTLKEKGFPASMTPGPNSLMRVLVGPYGDTQSMGRAKTELEREGFHPIRH